MRVTESAGCLKQERLEQLVVDVLDGVRVPEDLHVEVRGGDESGFSLLRGTEPIAERQFQTMPASCDERHATMSVVIALSIEHAMSSWDEQEVDAAVSPEETAEEHEPRASEVEGVGEKEASSPAEREPAPAPAQPEGFALEVHAGVGYSYGVLPEPAALAILGVSALLSKTLSVGLTGLSSERSRIEFELPPDATEEAFSSAESHLVALMARACWEQRFDQSASELCGGLAAGRVHSRGVEGFEPLADGASVPWLAALVHAGGRVPARGPMGLGFGVDLFANLMRPGVELEGSGTVTKPRDGAPVGGAGSLFAFFVLQ